MGFRALEAGKAVIKFMIDDSQLAKGMKAVELRGAKLGQKLKDIGRQATMAAAALDAGFAAALHQAARAQEAMNRFKAIFGEQSAAAEKFANDLANAVGRSERSIMGAMSNFQAFFVGLGFGGDEARKMSEQLTSLSLDFASFNDLSDAEAQQRFISALSGSSEVLDMFGVNIKQAALEQELLAQGVNKSWTEVTEQEKAVARLAVIMKAMTAQGAVGDAAKTAGSFANRMKTLTDQVADLAVKVGEALIPHATKLASYLIDVVKHVEKWVADNPKLVATLGDITLAVGVAGAAVGGLGLAITAVTAHPIIAGLTAVAAAAIGIANAFGDAADEAERAQRAIFAASAGNTPNLSQYAGLGAGLGDWARRKKSEMDAAKPTAADGAFEAIGGGIASAMKNGIIAAKTAASQAALAIGAGRESLSRMSAEQTVAGLQAGQGLDDDIRREQINAIEDEKERRKAAIEFETELMARSLKEQGILTPGNQAKLDELEARRKEAIDAAEDAAGGVSSSPAVTAILDASFAPQQFGKTEDKQTKVLEEIRDDARERERRPKPATFG